MKLKKYQCNMDFLMKFFASIHQIFFEDVQNVFRNLPLCAIFGEKIFCAHGGIGHNMPLLSEFELLAKPITIHKSDSLSDFLWSDPCKQSEKFLPNKRGLGCHFNDKP
jgi:diadenosine tetraphosphatase ApaH/serine/threonine PP2A family protein phosphatase